LKLKNYYFAHCSYCCFCIYAIRKFNKLLFEMISIFTQKMMLTNYWLWISIIFNVFTNAGFKYAAMAEANPKKKWTIFSVSLIFGFLNSICFTEALKSVSLNIASAVFFALTIVILALVSYYVFNESISPLHLAGVLVIVAGVIMVSL